MQHASAERIRDLTLAEFIDRLASSDPVPGGGSASAVAAGMGAALVTMVSTLSQGRDRYAQHAAMLAEVAASGRALAARFMDLADEDAGVYAGYMAAVKAPRDTEAQRTGRSAAVASAAKAAAQVPLETLRACLDLAVLTERLAGRSNVNAASDLTVAALFADAAAKAAGANVIINLPATTDGEWASDATRQVVELQAAIEDLARQTREVVGGGEAREPEPVAGRRR